MTDLPPLNTFLAALAEQCAMPPVHAERWLVAPSLRVGHQWLEALARRGAPALNLRPRTLSGLALELAGPTLAAEGRRFLRGRRREVLVGRVLAGLDTGPGYLTAVPPGPGLLALLARTLRELRLAGLTAAGLAADRFEVGAKGRELKRLLAGYEDALRDGGCVDEAEVLRVAASAVAENASEPLDGVTVLRAADLDPTALEAALWDALPARQRITLPVDPPADRPPGELQITRAVGEASELRAVLRALRADGTPLDEVEVVHTDAATYLPLAYELAARWTPDGDAELPLTFAEGIPVRFFRPGRALLAWIAWVQEGCPQPGLAQMIQDGLLDLDPRGFGFAGLAGVLRGVAIHGGRERYLPRLDAALAALDHRLADSATENARNDDDATNDDDAHDDAHEDDAHDDDGATNGDDAARRRRLRRRRDGLLRLRGALVSLLDDLPPAAGTPLVVTLGAAERFLARAVRCAGELEEYSRQELLRHVRESREALALDADGDLPGVDGWTWLDELVASVRVGGEPPRPGRLHVSGLDQGGHAARAHTVIIGLDDQRFPGAGLPDPLLLDSERMRLSPDLPTTRRTLGRRIERFRRLLGRLRGRTTLSFCGQDVRSGREQFPGSAILAAYEALTGDDQGDLEAMLAALGPPAALAPDAAAECLDATEWWTHQLTREPPPAHPRSWIAAHHPFLARGWQATAERASDRFTAYDGYVPAAGVALDPRSAAGPVLSASQLETLARCPLEFFLGRALRLRPPEDHTLDPDHWLDPAERGRLLHDLLRAFLAERIAAAEPVLVDPERDWPRLRELLETRAAALAEAVPAPSPAVRERELQDLRTAARRFLLAEAERLGRHAPRHLEVAVGVSPEGAGTPLDSEVPVAVPLPGGAVIRVRGRLDRIDDADPASPGRRFWVWDYKTGGASRARDPDPFRQGRAVQNVLYPLLAEARLRACVDPAAEVGGFGYLFVGPQALGEEQSWTTAELRPGLDRVADLVALLAAGCFPASSEARDNEWTDLVSALDSPAELAVQAARKLDGAGAAALAPLRRLRGRDDD